MEVEDNSGTTISSGSGNDPPIVPVATEGMASRSALEDVKMEMLERVAASNGHFKHQQRGDPDLTHTEKLQIAREILECNPCTFLSRYNKYLTKSDLAYFDNMKSDYSIDFYIKEIQKRQDTSKNKTKVRNRRYEAMKKLTEGGEYFSDKETKSRDPLLYEQMIGQYLSDEELQKQVQETDGSISSVLLQHIETIHNNELYTKQVDTQESQMEEEDEESEEEEKIEDEDSESELEDEPEKTITDHEKLVLRQEFQAIMEQRFLSGQDQEFDYSMVDDNVEYDSLDIREHDEEERYFDGEEAYDDADDLNDRLTDCTMDNQEPPHRILQTETSDKLSSQTNTDEDTLMENPDVVKEPT